MAAQDHPSAPTSAPRFWASRRRLLTGAGALTTGGGLLAGCAPRVIGLDRDRMSLDIANNAEPLSLDPHKASGTWENNIIGNMFVGLTTEDEHAEPVPGMALRWETSADNLTWRFFLREAQWSDGEPVTAHDFVFGFQRILDPATLAQYASVLYPIRNAEKVNNGELPPEAVGAVAIDDRTLELRLEHPAAYLPALLKHYTAYAVPAHRVRRYGSAWTRPENIATNGPYTLTEWHSNYIVTLQANPRFFDADKVAFKKLHYYPTINNKVTTRQIKSRERGWSTDFPDGQYEVLKNDPDMRGYVRVSPYLLVQYLSFRVTREPHAAGAAALPPTPFDEPRVRRALTVAIDREFIATRIYKTGWTPAYGFIPPGIANYPAPARQTWADMPLAERQEMARALLAEAGYGPGNPLTFEFKHRNSGDNPRVAVVVQDNWAKIGVNCSLVGTETQIHYDNLRARNFVIGDGGWVADYNDARNYLYLLETRTGPQNYPGYSNPTFDQLMRDQDSERDPAKRAAMLARAEQMVLDDAPICPIVFGVSKNLVHPDLAGFVDNPEDIHRARYFRLREA